MVLAINMGVGAAIINRHLTDFTQKLLFTFIDIWKAATLKLGRPLPAREGDGASSLESSAAMATSEGGASKLGSSFPEQRGAALAGEGASPSTGGGETGAGMGVTSRKY